MLDSGGERDGDYSLRQKYRPCPRRHLSASTLIGFRAGPNYFGRPMMRLSNYRHEGPHNRTLALLTERDVQDALGDRMPPDDGGAEYPRWETGDERNV